MAQSLSSQTWTNTAGQSITATFAGLQEDVVKLRLAGGKFHELHLEDLSLESALQAIGLKWKPGGITELRLDTPDRVGLAAVEVKRDNGKETAAEPVKPGWIRYRTPHFQFDSELELTPAFLKRAGLAFESTRLLLQELPWRIQSKPLQGQLFQARIYESDESYFAAGGPVGSTGVFRPSNGEFSLPWQGEGKNLDTMQHEIAHQMMQRILPVMPWWIAEGTAEYVSIMKYQNGYFACNVVSKRQVTPELKKCADLVKAPGGLGNPFEAAMTYRGETNAEAVMEQYLAGSEREMHSIAQHFKTQIANVKKQLAPLEEKRDMFVKMFALESGQSCQVDFALRKPVPTQTGEPSPKRGTTEIKWKQSPIQVIAGLQMSQRYAASTILV